MKIVLVLIFLCGVWSRNVPLNIFDIWLKISSPYNEDCSAKANVPTDYTNDFILSASLPDELKFKMFLVCMYEKLEFFLKDGEFDKKAIMEKASYMTDELTTNCINKAIKEQDRLNKSYIVALCITDGLAV